MVETFEAIAVAAVALLPGALYVWGFERQVGNWGIGLSDRLLRFFGTSALFHVLIAPLTYWVWAEFVRPGDLSEGTPLPPYLWLIVVAYMVIPFDLGTRVGRGTREGATWAERFTGPNPAPRAWEHFFTTRPEGWIRLRLKSGVWIGGVYTSSGAALPSYAGGYPEPQDLFLSETAELDPSTGEFILESGAPIFRGTSLLIRWDEIEFFEFSEA